jgi:hypothetical protein
LRPDDTGPDYDPFCREVDSIPNDVLMSLSDEAPMYRNESHGVYTLSQFAGIQAARLDIQTFNSTGGVTFERMLDWINCSRDSSAATKTVTTSQPSLA